MKNDDSSNNKTKSPKEDFLKEIKSTNEIEDFNMKIVIIGDSAVGKTNLLSRFIRDEFNLNTKSTVGVEFQTKTYKKQDKVIKVTIWDTAGQERFKSLTRGFYKGAQGALIVYDITNKNSFDNIDTWITEFRSQCESSPIILIGNKLDLEKNRSVSNESAIDKSINLNVPFLETSALDSTNIDKAFNQLISEIYLKTIKLSMLQDEQKFDNGNTIQVSKTKLEGIQKKKCC